MKRHLTRRDFARLSGAALATTVLAPGVHEAAAAGGQVVVGTWGGDYENLLQAHVAEQVMKPSGIAVIYDTGGDPARRNKLMAERRLPRGSMDIAALNAAGCYEMWKNGAVEDLDFSKIPNSKHIIAPLRTNYAVPHIYSGQVILYNPKLIKNKPTSYADLWAPENQDKVGIIDIQYIGTIQSAAMINGGSMSNYEPGKEKLLELKKRGVKIYPTNEAMAQALKTEECGMCIMWKARGVMWQNAGIPIEMANPKEGIVLYVSGMVMAKNARNKEQAYAWLDALLDPRAQGDFAKHMGYAPTVDNVTLEPSLASRVMFEPEAQNAFVLQDQDYLAKADAGLQEWWNKVFKG
ncbi:MAG: ABC transporter substrate-binding protein [Hyphomicrobiales bacterium]|nr:ABC transporter substrate-binding protein [Hyphomicrobiales bacterium]